MKVGSRVGQNLFKSVAIIANQIFHFDSRGNSHRATKR
jgi:hypothetical protein